MMCSTLDGSVDMMSVHVMDEDVGRDDLIGRCEVPLSALVATAGDRNPTPYKLYDANDVISGTLMIRCESFAAGAVITALQANTQAAPPPPSKQADESKAKAAADAKAEADAKQLATITAAARAQAKARSDAAEAAEADAHAAARKQDDSRVDAAENEKKAKSAAAEKAQASALEAKANANRARTKTIGKLTVFVVSGKNLKDMDTIGKQDPYLVLQAGRLPEVKGAVMTDGGTNPAFNQRFTFDLPNSDELNDGKLRINVFDEDVGKDDHIGSGDITFVELIRAGAAGLAVPIYQSGSNLSNKTKTGDILLRCESFVDGAAGLDAIAAQKQAEADAANRAKATADASFASTLNAAQSAAADRQSAKAKSEADRKQREQLETEQLIASGVANAKSNAAPASAQVPTTGVGSDILPIGQLKLTVLSGKGLKDMDSIGKQDPYLVLKCGGGQELKGAVITDGGVNPTFNQTFSLYVSLALSLDRSIALSLSGTRSLVFC